MKRKLTSLAAVAATVALTAALTGAAVQPHRSVRAVTKATPPKTPTFTKDIAPILYENCTTCHRPGQIAPFPLVTYTDAKKRAQLIAAVTNSHYMPPWKAEPGFGHFRGARRLTDTQIATLQKWADAGTPQGAPRFLPPLPHFPEGWQLGKPDLILKMPKAYTVPAEGPDVQRCFVVPIPVLKDSYVVGYEFRPSDTKVVHHAILYTDASGVAQKKQTENEQKPGEVGYPSFGGPGFLPSTVLGAWVPGETPESLPDGIAKPLPAHNDLVIQIHFHPTGKPETEQSEVGLYFAKKPPTKLVEGILEGNFKLNIPPGDKNYVARDSFTLPIDVHALSIQPHAHLLCKDMKVTATLPDGKIQPMIWIKNWDWNWQGAYPYAKPVRLPKGTRLDMVYTYDNSADNPHNPNNPPQWVRFGEQTKDEMALCGIEVTADNAADAPVLRQALVWHLVSNFLGGGNGRGTVRPETIEQLLGGSQASGPKTP